MYTYIYIYMYTLICIYIYTHTYMCVYIYRYISIYEICKYCSIMFYAIHTQEATWCSQERNFVASIVAQAVPSGKLLQVYRGAGTVDSHNFFVGKSSISIGTSPFSMGKLT